MLATSYVCGCMGVDDMCVVYVLALEHDYVHNYSLEDFVKFFWKSEYAFVKKSNKDT